MRKEWYLYILRCRDKSLYTGITTNIKRRLAMHANGRGSRIVRSKLPVKLVYKEKHKTQSQALKREIEIKQWPRKRKLALLQNKKEIVQYRLNEF